MWIVSSDLIRPEVSPIATAGMYARTKRAERSAATAARRVLTRMAGVVELLLWRLVGFAREAEVWRSCRVELGACVEQRRWALGPGAAIEAFDTRPARCRPMDAAK